MTQPHDWCRTVECDGTTVLLMRGWNDEYDRPMMSTTFQIDHFIAGDTEFGETTVSAMKEEEDAPPFTDREWLEYCQPDAVYSRVHQVVSCVLRATDALH